MAEIQRLIGEDGKICKVAFGTEKSGDATKTFDVQTGGTAGDKSGAGFWKITAKATTGSIFDTGVTGTYKVGDIYKADGTEVMATGDKASKATLTELADVSTFSLELSKDEIEVTVLGDGTKKYRYGKSDANGSLEGVTMIDSTLGEGGMASRFLRRIAVPATGNTVITEADNSPLYVFMYANKSEAAGEKTVFVYSQISLGGYKLGAKSGEAQNWTSGFRLIGADPVMYEIEN